MADETPSTLFGEPIVESGRLEEEDHQAGAIIIGPSGRRIPLTPEMVDDARPTMHIRWIENRLREDLHHEPDEES